MSHRLAKAAIALFATGMLGAGAYAFTNTNNVDASYAGAGSAAINGYTVTGIHYGTTPNVNGITSVSFNLNAPATSVSAGLNQPPPPGNGPGPQLAGPAGPPPILWLRCGPVGAGPTFSVTCSVPGPAGYPIAQADMLFVNAAQ
ncbi:MAG: hypothetical protein ACYCWN_04015 [Ferrimicrobium sp.]|uniref:SipW-cognate class signal peptide n=1 Tax=Ferrimicrobium acidiphilum TaxID=121039 RepID=A0ABV3XYT9_9ACTN|nr:hypothetical protein [Ferrimicrobium sp.]